jgi:hypothetical protein
LFDAVELDYRERRERQISVDPGSDSGSGLGLSALFFSPFSLLLAVPSDSATPDTRTRESGDPAPASLQMRSRLVDPLRWAGLNWAGPSLCKE